MSSIQAGFAEAHARLVRARKRVPRMTTRALVGAVVSAERFLLSDEPFTIPPSFSLAAAACEELAKRGADFCCIYDNTRLEHGSP